MIKGSSSFVLATALVGCGWGDEAPDRRPVRSEREAARPPVVRKQERPVSEFLAEAKRESAKALAERWLPHQGAWFIGMEVPPAKVGFAPVLGAKPRKGTVGYREVRPFESGKLRRDLTEERLSPAERANGMEYRVKVAIWGQMARDHDKAGVLTGGVAGWSKWQDLKVPLLSFTLTRVKGRWEVSKLVENPIEISLWKGRLFRPKAEDLPAR